MLDTLLINLRTFETKRTRQSYLQQRVGAWEHLEEGTESRMEELASQNCKGCHTFEAAQTWQLQLWRASCYYLEKKII